MYDAGKIIPGLIVFLGLVLIPVWYNAGTGMAGHKPELVKPAPPKSDQCVLPAETMRAKHMASRYEHSDRRRARGGEVPGNAPDTGIGPVGGDVAGARGPATMTPADPTELGVQATQWALSVTGLRAGAHDLFIDAVDEADTVRTTTLSIVVP